ncbi:uncharacterized protein LOC132561504 [Ylistrum balloti]|uniref:uncharacterized protein LOC132561504 n=1 Tax=Ylistrum balloti TaxID=509963 RepID=UPI002905E0C4|nr:uncharacterized protein LOC132561504 [Ylistrum balloti]
MVDLGEKMTLEGFNITYRQEEAPRMSGFRLIVSNTSIMVDGISGTLCYEETRPNPPTIQYIDCFVIGQYVFYEDPTTAPGDTVPFIELCELEAFGCPNGYYGADCNISCVESCVSGICHPDNGTCVYGCQPMLIGDKCDQVCMNGTWGDFCNKTCFCDIDTCNISTGMCQEDRCQSGWQGMHCNQLCDTNMYGPGCNLTCGECYNSTCDHVTGYCPGLCSPGWSGPMCSTQCEMYKYGRNCLSTCGHCKDNETCYHVDGVCSNGCGPGYQGDKCDTECSTGTFGENCSQLCFCMFGSCHYVTGKCDIEVCQMGYRGPSCSEVCLPGQFGENCSMTCHCLVDGCQPSDGLCIENAGCDAGWQGPSCSQACNDGTYGVNCDQICGACKNSVICDHKSGVCPSSCEPGWTGLLCKTACNPGNYGEDCKQICNCRNNVSCDPVAGTCPRGECDVGWTGSACSDLCPLGTYSYNCQKKCNCLNGYCNPVDPDGVCPPTGCLSGWTGVSCNEVCRNGTYGPSCTWICGACYADVPCDHMSGVCPSGCSPGYTGLTCIATCPPTRYGEGCQSLCSENCVNQECDRFNSSCTSGCKSGYQGHACTDPVVLRLADDHWAEQTNLVLYVIAGILFLLAFLAVLCCLRRRTLKEKKMTAVGIDIEEHAVKVSPLYDLYFRPVGGSVPNPDIKADDGKQSKMGTSMEDLPTDDQATLVDNQLNSADEKPEPVVEPTEIFVLKEEMDADEDNEDDNDEDYPTGDVGQTGMGSISLAARSGTDKNSDMPVATTYGFMIPEIAGTRIVLSGFVTTIKDKKQFGNLANEFKNLPEGRQHPVEEGKRPENKAKNRFRNILPYDHSRVVLEDENGENDYINASFIDGMDSERQYIATQGPKPDTVADFWRMIWENNCGKVMMLANIMEKSRSKCHQYWPNVSETGQYGTYVVKTMNEKKGTSFTVREIQLHRAQDETMSRTIHQLHFTTWPDHGTPTVEQLLRFHSTSTNIETPLQGPDVVHCSAGVGRTGTYIALDALWKHARYATSLDVYEYTLKMRKDRMNMIQTLDQYICLHETLAEGLPNATS